MSEVDPLGELEPRRGPPIPKTPEFPVDDDLLELMADAALGPDPIDVDEESELDPEQQHRLAIRARTRGARLLVLPSVRDVLSARRKRVFLVTLAECGIVGTACARAGWSRNVVLGLRKADPEFSARYDEALEFAADVAEAEAFRRGVHGYQRPVFGKEGIKGHETVYSDRLLELTLKARRPDRFRDNHRVDHEVRGGVLVIPQRSADEGSWEDQAMAGQAKYRALPDGTVEGEFTEVKQP